MRRQYIQASIGEDAAEKAATGGIAAGEKISRSTLEDEARQSTLKGRGTPEEKFWLRQQGQAETIAIGKSYIAKVSSIFCRKHTADLIRPLPTRQRRQRRQRRNCNYDERRVEWSGTGLRGYGISGARSFGIASRGRRVHKSRPTDGAMGVECTLPLF